MDKNHLTPELGRASFLKMTKFSRKKELEEINQCESLKT